MAQQRQNIYIGAPTAAQDYFGLADKYLADAIAIDAYKNPEEFIYRVP